MGLGKFVFGFLTGAAAGFAASAMVSEETKNELAKKGQDLKEKASDYANEAKEKASDYASQASNQFSDYATQAAEKAEELKANSQDKLEDFKAKYDQSTDALKDQIKRHANQANDNSEITDFDDIVIDGKQAFDKAKDSSQKMISDIDSEIKK